MYSTIVVGGGPGGLGPLIWAAQQGLLPHWLDQGVAIVERQDSLGGNLGRYGIHSDSLGGSYLECLDAPALPESLRALRDDPAALEIAHYRDSFPPLQLVDRYMRRLGDAIAAMMAEHPASALLLGTEAHAVQLCRDGTVAVDVRHANGSLDRLTARSAVIALGGRQLWQQRTLVPGVTIGDCVMRRSLPSDQLLARAGLVEANEILAASDRRRIMILGGAHSAYAAARAILTLPAAATLAPEQIAIVQRRPPHIFYPDPAAAAADFYPVMPGDICPRTGRVNRMGGLRGHGRDIWRQITHRPDTTIEPRVTMLALQDFSASAIRSALESAALVVPCLGYRSATLPVYDAREQRLALGADADRDAVGDDCRLRLADGGSLPALFGIGLGTGYRPSGSMGGEPNFDGQANSLWLYHHDIGAVIFRAIQTLLRKVPAAVAAKSMTGLVPIVAVSR